MTDEARPDEGVAMVNGQVVGQRLCEIAGVDPGRAVAVALECRSDGMTVLHISLLAPPEVYEAVTDLDAEFVELVATERPPE